MAKQSKDAMMSPNRANATMIETAVYDHLSAPLLSPGDEAVSKRDRRCAGDSCACAEGGDCCCCDSCVGGSRTIILANLIVLVSNAIRIITVAMNHRYSLYYASDSFIAYSLFMGASSILSNAFSIWGAVVRNNFLVSMGGFWMFVQITMDTIFIARDCIQALSVGHPNVALISLSSIALFLYWVALSYYMYDAHRSYVIRDECERDEKEKKSTSICCV